MSYQNVSDEIGIGGISVSSSGILTASSLTLAVGETVSHLVESQRGPLVQVELSTTAPVQFGSATVSDGQRVLIRSNTEISLSLPPMTVLGGSGSFTWVGRGNPRGSQFVVRQSGREYSLINPLLSAIGEPAEIVVVVTDNVLGTVASVAFTIEATQALQPAIVDSNIQHERASGRFAFNLTYVFLLDSCLTPQELPVY